MFFILSKVLYFLIQPMNWVLGLMLYALLAKKPVRKKRSLLLAVVLGIFFTNHFIFNEVVRCWEVETLTADEITQPYDIGILLGGYSNPHIRPTADRMNFSRTANRFLNAYELYRNGKIRKILLTGGSGSLLQNHPSEAVEAREFLLEAGVPDSNIIVEGASRNTYESAVFTQKILAEKHPGASCLLLTSAWHMRRSVGCFRKAGVQFTPFSVDHLTEVRRWEFENTLIPDRMGFAWWEAIIKEWVGCVMYRLQGYL